MKYLLLCQQNKNILKEVIFLLLLWLYKCFLYNLFFSCIEFSKPKFELDADSLSASMISLI